MVKTLVITYETSNEHIPIMCVEESSLLSNKCSRSFIFTGKKAEQLYKELTGLSERSDKKK